MPTLFDIVKSSLNEGKDPIKIFYEIDVFIQEFKNDEEGKEAENEEPSDNEVADKEVQNEEVMMEAIFKFKKEGKLILAKEESENILALNDLIDFLDDKKINGKPIMNKIVSEVILILSGTNTGQLLDDIINEGDKFKVTIDYGISKFNSIGIKVVKNAGTKVISFLLRKDGKNIGKFNLPVFEKQLLFFSQEAS